MAASERGLAMAVCVRAATPRDMPLVHQMIHELAAYEGVPDGPKLSVEELVEDGFSASPPWFFVLLAVRGGGGGGGGAGDGAGEGAAEGEVVGYALCHRAYSSWTRRAFYVEDLGARGRRCQLSAVSPTAGCARRPVGAAMAASERGLAMAVCVRAATPRDMPLVHQMIHELAAYEGVPDGPKLSVEELVEDGFSASPPWFFVLLAVRGGGGGGGGAGDGAGEGAAEGEVVGYALCHRAYSSWTRRAFYVEDLYVRPAARRRGVATRLLARLAQMAVSAGARSVDWHVLADNAPARALYGRLGARDLRASEGRLALRLDAPGIDTLAALDRTH